jgi:hypothetical protein
MFNLSNKAVLSYPFATRFIFQIGIYLDLANDFFRTPQNILDKTTKNFESLFCSSFLCL